MKCVLKVDVLVCRIAVFAEMAWIERRPELGIVCRAAKEAERRIDAALVQRVLPGVADPGARNIIDWCRTLDLCDRQGGLTAVGDSTADSDEAPVPEQGVFALWVVDHPLLGQRILHAQRLKLTRDARFEEAKPLPIDPERRRIFASVVDPKQRFILRDVPSQNGPPGCIHIHQDRSICRLRWTLDFTAGKEQFQLEGTLDVNDENLGIRHEAEHAGMDLDELRKHWAAVHLSRHGRFRPEKRQLAVPFDGLNEFAQEQFVRSFAITQVEVPGKGNYDDSELENVAIGPLSAGDAQRWARARFDRRLAKEHRYRTRADLRKLFTSLVDGTPLAEHHPRLPDHATLLQETRGQPSVFWGLGAPVDLSPVALDRGELASFVAAPVDAGGAL